MEGGERGGEITDQKYHRSTVILARESTDRGKLSCPLFHVIVQDRISVMVDTPFWSP